MTRTAVIAFLCLYAFFARAACPSIDSRLDMIARLEESYGGGHEIISGAEAEAFMQAFNALPPVSDIQADRLILYRPGAMPGAAVLVFIQGVESCPPPLVASRTDLDSLLRAVRRGAI